MVDVRKDVRAIGSAIKGDVAKVQADEVKAKSFIKSYGLSVLALIVGFALGHFL